MPDPLYGFPRPEARKLMQIARAGMARAPNDGGVVIPGRKVLNGNRYVVQPVADVPAIVESSGPTFQAIAVNAYLIERDLTTGILGYRLDDDGNQVLIPVCNLCSRAMAAGRLYYAVEDTFGTYWIVETCVNLELNCEEESGSGESSDRRDCGLSDHLCLVNGDKILKITFPFPVKVEEFPVSSTAAECDDLATFDACDCDGSGSGSGDACYESKRNRDQVISITNGTGDVTTADVLMEYHDADRWESLVASDPTYVANHSDGWYGIYSNGVGSFAIHMAYDASRDVWEWWPNNCYANRKEFNWPDCDSSTSSSFGGCDDGVGEGGHQCGDLSGNEYGLTPSGITDGTCGGGGTACVDLNTATTLTFVSSAAGICWWSGGEVLVCAVNTNPWSLVYDSNTETMYLYYDADDTTSTSPSDYEVGYSASTAAWNGTGNLVLTKLGGGNETLCNTWPATLTIGKSN